MKAFSACTTIILWGDFMIINPGEFRHKITIQKGAESTDSVGNPVIDWKEWKKLYAKINSLYGQEYWQAAAQGQENTVVFTLRWSKELEILAQTKEITQHRIVYNKLPYDIISYDNVNFENRLVKIKAVNR